LGVVAADEVQASVTVDDPAARRNFATSPEPPTVAVIDILPGVLPRVTCVLARPDESVVAAGVMRVAVPEATAKFTATPLAGALFVITLTTRGLERA